MHYIGYLNTGQNARRRELAAAALPLAAGATGLAAAASLAKPAAIHHPFARRPARGCVVLAERTCAPPERGWTPPARMTGVARSGSVRVSARLTLLIHIPTTPLLPDLPGDPLGNRMRHRGACIFGAAAAHGPSTPMRRQCAVKNMEPVLGALAAGFSLTSLSLSPP